MSIAYIVSESHAHDGHARRDLTSRSRSSSAKAVYFVCMSFTFDVDDQ